MAIRIKNLDLQTEGMKRSIQTYLGDFTATGKRLCFVAPVACVVDHIDVYVTERMPPAQASASATIVRIQAALATASGSTLQVRTSTSASNATNAVSANSRIRLTPSANNSLSVGTPLILDLSAQGSGNLSNTIVITTYTPQKHRETR